MKKDLLKLYRPTFVTILVMGVGKDAEPGYRKLVDLAPDELFRRIRRLPTFPSRIAVYKERNLFILAHRKAPFPKPKGGDGQLSEVSMDQIVRQTENARKEASHLARIVSDRVRGLQPLGRFLMICAGSEEKYWFQSKIDMSQMVVSLTRDEKVLKDLSAKSKIDLLASGVEDTKSYMGDSLTQVRNSPLLVGFKPAVPGPGPSLPRTYFLDVEMEEPKEGSISATMDEDQYNGTLGTVTETFGRLLAHQCLIMNSFNNVYPKDKVQAERIRDQIQELQSAINQLLKGELTDGGIQRLHRAGMGPHGRTEEEKLLHLASMYFSQVTEFDAALESNTYDTHESKVNAGRYADILGMTKPSPSEYLGESILSLNEELARDRDTVHYSYQNLKGTVNNSQRSLQNSVEILKTSLENKQREINEMREEVWNFLIVILATFGLMDAITNFMIFYLEGNSAVTTVTYFFISMLPILIVLAIIGAVMSKRLR